MFFGNVTDSENIGGWKSNGIKLCFPWHKYEGVYETKQEDASSIFKYIEVFYNRIRRHTSIGGVSPAEYKAMLLQKAA
ncbi:MAG: IS3 family transposase [Elusimicrobiota bacterium]